MNLYITAVFIAVCGAAKLDRSYLPPPSAATAGGSPGSLQTPLTRSPEQGLETPNPPTGSYTNEFGGVVVDAAAPGSRSTADAALSALGGPRQSYGSTDSKVGDAAFSGSAGFRSSPSFGAAPAQISYKEHISAENTQYHGQGQGDSVVNAQFGQSGQASANAQLNTHASQFPSNGAGNSQSTHAQFSSNGFNFPGFENNSERPQAAKDRNSNILALSNDVNTDGYSYGFETDNGIAVGENGVAANGIQAEGGYSYQGDDGQVYKVTYTADEDGYRPQGAHLPTPPPIPEEILKSLEQNAKDEASGVVDDGSYNAQKYNADGGYTHDGGNIQHNGAQLSQFGKRPESDATASGTFINQNRQAFGTPGSGNLGTAQGSFNGQSNMNGKPGNHLGALGSQHNHPGFNGQVTQVNEGSGHFGISGSQNKQDNKKPSLTSIGVAGSQNTHSSFNDQSSNGILSSGQFGSQSAFNGQITHEKLEQTGFQNAQSSLNAQTSKANGNQHESNLASTQYGFSQKSQSSQSINGHDGSSATGQNIGQSSGNQFSSSGHFSSASASAQVENQSSKPGVSSNQLGVNSQSESIPSKPTFGAGSSNFNSQSTQSQPESSFKPQGSEAFPGASLDKDQDNQDFGKPYPQTFSGQNFNRPSSGNFNSKPKTFAQGQINQFGATETNFNRFPQAPSGFGSRNEYLPPFNTFGQTQSKQPTGFNSNLSSSGLTSGFLNNQNSKNVGKVPSFIGLNGQNPSASASASSSFGQSAIQPQAAKPLVTFNNQYQSKPNQFSQQQSSQFIQQTNKLSFQTPTQIDSNTQQAFGTRSVHNFEIKPTLVPDTELTTPLEPNEIPTSHSSQSHNQTPAISGNFNSKPNNNNPGQSQSYSQGNSVLDQQSATQTFSNGSPTTSLQSNNQFGASSIGSFGLNSGNSNQGQTHFGFQQNSAHKTTSQTSSFPQQSFSSDTNKPQFPQSTSNNQNQQLSNQGLESYYYNQPSKPFGALAARPQGSRFPVSLPHQPNGVASQSQFFSQQSSFQSSSKLSGSPVVPTSDADSAQLPQNQGFNGVTQAAVSSFPSAPPTSNLVNQNGQFGSNFNQQSSFTSQVQSSGPKQSFSPHSTFTNQVQQTKFSQQAPGLPAPRPIPQFGQNPISSSQAQHHFEQNNRPNSSDGSSQDGSSQQQTTVTQQYQGTVYEYNKPPEVLPAPSDSSSSQSVEKSVASEPKPSLEIHNNQENSKTSQVEAFNQNKLFGSANQFVQSNQNSQDTGFPNGSQPDKISNSPSSAIQFNHNTQSSNQQAKPSSETLFSSQSAQQYPDSSVQQNTQALQTAQSFKPFGAASQGIQSSFGAKPQFVSQSFRQATQSFSNPQPAQVSGSQAFGSTGSNQGYFYNKPQLPDSPKNQFNQNPRFVSKPGSFNHQNTQFNTAFKPQFGAQIPTQASSQASGTFNKPSSNAFLKPQIGTETNQNTFSQKSPNTPFQPFSQPQKGQSSASSQAVAFGQGSASALASTSQFKPFEQKPQVSEQNPESQDQSEQGTQQLETQGSLSSIEDTGDSKPYGALKLTPSVGSPVSKPLFNSHCCQDTITTQSSERPSTSFQGSSFNAQSFAGKGEQFGGPRAPPKFDENGYHY